MKTTDQRLDSYDRKHALSLLMANRPHLIPLTKLEFGPNCSIPVRDRRLLTLGKLFHEDSQLSGFAGSLYDLALVDLEGLSMAIDFVISERMRDLG